MRAFHSSSRGFVVTVKEEKRVRGSEASHDGFGRVELGSGDADELS